MYRVSVIGLSSIDEVFLPNILFEVLASPTCNWPIVVNTALRLKMSKKALCLFQWTFIPGTFYGF